LNSFKDFTYFPEKNLACSRDKAWLFLLQFPAWLPDITILGLDVCVVKIWSQPQAMKKKSLTDQSFMWLGKCK
jgi:hypothetical protein